MLPVQFKTQRSSRQMLFVAMLALVTLSASAQGRSSRAAPAQAPNPVKPPHKPAEPLEQAAQPRLSVPANAKAPTAPESGADGLASSSSAVGTTANGASQKADPNAAPASQDGVKPFQNIVPQRPNHIADAGTTKEVPASPSQSPSPSSPVPTTTLSATLPTSLTTTPSEPTLTATPTPTPTSSTTLLTTPSSPSSSTGTVLATPTPTLTPSASTPTPTPTPTQTQSPTSSVTKSPTPTATPTTTKSRKAPTPTPTSTPVKPAPVKASQPRLVEMEVTQNGGQVKTGPPRQRVLFPVMQSYNLKDRRGNSAAAVNADGTLAVVANRGTHMLTVYKLPSGEILHSFGGRGNSPGRFSYPHSVAWTPTGNILVAEWANGRVQEVTITGESVKVIGNVGASATAVAATEEFIVVLQAPNSENQVFMVYDYKTGAFLRGFGENGGETDKLAATAGGQRDRVRLTTEKRSLLLTEGRDNTAVSFYRVVDEPVKCLDTAGTVKLCVFSSGTSKLVKDAGNQAVDAALSVVHDKAYYLIQERLAVYDLSADTVK